MASFLRSEWSRQKEMRWTISRIDQIVCDGETTLIQDYLCSSYCRGQLHLYRTAEYRKR